MRVLDPAILEALATGRSALVTCQEIVRRDGVALRMTSADIPLVVDGALYHPMGSTERTAVEMSDGLTADNLVLRGVFVDGLVAPADILSGRLDHATVRVFLAFADGAAPGIVPLTEGRFGQARLQGLGYEVEMANITHALQASVGEVTTPGCRAQLGDARCQVNLAVWQFDRAIASLPDARMLVLASALPGLASTFAQGVLEVLTGAAAGLRMEIRAVAGTTVEMYLPLGTAPAVGDTVRITAGCDKSRATCRAVFANTINFQGEPDLPGLDALVAPEVTS